MDFESVCAVFQGVRDTGGFGRELLGLSNGDETRIEAVGQSGGKNWAGRFDPPYDVNGVGLVVVAEAINQRVKPLLVFQQGGQVVKENSRLRVIRHFADQLFQVVHFERLPFTKAFSNKFRSSAGIDDEFALIPRVRCGRLFLNFADAGETRSALQHGAKFRVLLWRAHGKYFHAAVTKLSDETMNAQSFRGGLGKITKAHALDHSRHEIPLGKFSVAHESLEL